MWIGDSHPAEVSLRPLRWCSKAALPNYKFTQENFPVEIEYNLTAHAHNFVWDGSN